MPEAAPSMVPAINPQGELVRISSADFQRALGQGFQAPSAEQLAQLERLEKAEGVGQGAAAFGEGALSALTFGVGPKIEEAFGVEPADIAARKEVHPIAHTAGEIAGVAAPLILTAGAGAPASAAAAGVEGAEAAAGAARAAPGILGALRGAADFTAPGLISRAGEAARAGVEAAGLPGVLGRFAPVVAQGAAEGALYGGADVAERQALQDPTLTAEGAAAEVGLGALFGGGLMGFGKAAGEGFASAVEKVSNVARRGAERLAASENKEALRVVLSDEMRPTVIALDRTAPGAADALASAAHPETATYLLQNAERVAQVNAAHPGILQSVLVKATPEEAAFILDNASGIISGTIERNAIGQTLTDQITRTFQQTSGAVRGAWREARSAEMEALASKAEPAAAAKQAAGIFDDLAAKVDELKRAPELYTPGSGTRLERLGEGLQRDLAGADDVAAAADPPPPDLAGRTAVADEAGTPIPVYHGTNGEFSEFKQSGDMGIHFTANEATASEIARVRASEAAKEGFQGARYNGAEMATGQPRVVKAFLDIKKPLRMLDMEDWKPGPVADELERMGVLSEDEAIAFGRKGASLQSSDIISALRRKGYDGISYINDFEGGGISYMAFEPSQVRVVRSALSEVAESEAGAALAGGAKKATSAAPAETYLRLNRLKQSLDDMIPWGSEASTAAGRDTTALLKDLRGSVRSALEDSSVWGEAADRQRDFNRAFQAYKDAAKRLGAGKQGGSLEARILRKVDDGAGGITYEANEKTVNAWLNAMADARGGAKSSAFNAYLDKAEALSAEMGRSGYDGAEHLGGALRQMRTDFAATEQRATVNQVINRLKNPGEILVSEGFIPTPGALAREAGKAVLGEVIPGAGVVSRTATATMERLRSPSMMVGLLGGLASLAERTQNAIRGRVGRIFESEAAAASGSAARAVTPETYPNVSADLHRYGGDLDALADRVAQSTSGLSDHAPATADALHALAARVVQHLQPLVPAGPDRLPLSPEHRPSPAELIPLNRAHEVVLSPMRVLDHVARGTLDVEHIRALDAVYPRLAQEMRTQVLDRLATHRATGKSIPRQSRLALSMFLGADLDHSTTQATIAANQAAFASSAKSRTPGAVGGGDAGKGGGKASAIKSPAKFATISQRSEGREIG